jgi:uncharacterized membrane protein (DUF2068 family)
VLGAAWERLLRAIQLLPSAWAVCWLRLLTDAATDRALDSWEAQGKPDLHTFSDPTHYQDDPD